PPGWSSRSRKAGSAYSFHTRSGSTTCPSASTTCTRLSWSSTAPPPGWSDGSDLQGLRQLLVVVAGIAQVVLPELGATRVQADVVVEHEGDAGVLLVGLAVEVRGGLLAEGHGDGRFPEERLAGVDAVRGLLHQQL